VKDLGEQGEVLKEALQDVAVGEIFDSSPIQPAEAFEPTPVKAPDAEEEVIEQVSDNY
jgi:hypothetical protein